MLKIGCFSILLLLLAGCTDLPPTATPAVTATSLPPTSTATPIPTRVVVPTNTPQPTHTPLPTAIPTPTTTTLILWESLPQAQMEQLSLELAAFQQRYPRFQIQQRHYEESQVMAAAIIDGRLDYHLLLGPATLLAPLQRTAKIQAMHEFFSADFLDGFIGNSLTGITAEGQVWGLPDSFGFHLLLFYNRNLVDQVPTTEGELTALAQAWRANGRWGLVMNSRDPLWLVPWLHASGGWLVDDAGQPTLDSPAMVEALTVYRDWHGGEDSIVPITSYVEAQTLFYQGQAAMMIDGEWAINELKQHGTMPWGVARLPTLQADEQVPAPIVLARYWAIGADITGPQAEAAIAFLEFITRPERQLTWTRAFGLLPTQRAALAAPPLLTDPILRVSVRQLQTGRGIPLNTNLNALLDAMRDPLDQVLTGQLTPSAAAALMQANLE